MLTTYFNKYVMGFIIVLGISGNILSIVVFGRCKSRDLVTVTYLTPLAYADLTTLFYGAYSWIVVGVLEEPEGYFFIEPRMSLAPQLLCKCIRFVYRTSSCISSYILVLFSCERCIGVWFPLRVLLITNKRRLAAISITIIVQFFVNIPVLISYSVYYVSGTTSVACYFVLPDFSKVGKFFFIQLLDSFIPHAFPCCLILTFSILIITGVRQADRKTAAFTGRKPIDKANLVSLLLVSLLYIVSTLPYVTIWGYFDYFDHYLGDFLWHTEQEATALYMLGLFSTSVSMMNYSFNFLIYSFTLKIYKDELKRIMGRISFGSKQLVQ
jgi:hypothetical protein